MDSTQQRHLKQLFRVRQLQCMDLNLNKLGEDMLRRAASNLYCTARREGTEDRAKRLLESNNELEMVDATTTTS